MLFPYIRTRHDMRYMHAFVTYIFTKVWCKAPTIEYSLDLFKGMPKLHAIMDGLAREDLAQEAKKKKGNGAGAFFYLNINIIFNEFKRLTPAEIKTLRKYFLANNNIEALCEGRVLPILYSQFSQSNLDQQIQVFFSKLYSGGFFNLKIVKDNIGVNLREHYQDFAKINDIPCCPFCGLQPMDTEYDPTREAYDHYLPASKYPFNSVNLKNLAPACYKCNSQNKGAKDPLIDDEGNARRAFYPYSHKSYNIDVSLTFLCDNRTPTTSDEIQVNLTCAGYEQELDTWNALYRVKERLKARCCSTAASKAWMNRINIECQNYNRDPKEALEAELATCHESLWTEAAFLKSAYLKEAERKNLLPKA
tara:strand:- start:853 stop:1941 length:1089 start_codon:yes stop_codon:yes gene_type:complete